MRVEGFYSLFGLALFTETVSATIPEDTCIPIISTVFATPDPIYVTITIHDIPKPTVAATITSISVERFHPSPTAAPNHNPVPPNPKQVADSYDNTVYQTVYVTVTIGKPEKSTAQGPLSFIIVDGTTSWLGETPSAGESLVYASSASIITVVPKPQIESMKRVQSTTTLTSTITSHSTFTVVTFPTSTIVLGTGTFTGKPIGGWKISTVIAAHTNPNLKDGESSRKPTLNVEDSAFELYLTTNRSSIAISSFEALSGFQQYTTLTGPSLTYAPGGLTTAVINGETLSWTVTAQSPTIHAPTYPPYANSTLSTFYTVATPTAPASSGISNDTEARNPASILSSEISLVVSGGLTTTFSSSSPSASSSQCGVTGDFTLNFDDIPPLSIGNQSIDDVAPMPVFNPYQKFKFSDGFVVVPPPRVPYLPSSKPLLLEFIPNFTVNVTDENSGPNSREFGWSGDIGNGDQGRTGCFSFSAYGASIGCDSRADDCVFSFSGFRFDRSTMLSNQVTYQRVSVPACPQLIDCPLTSITLDDTFKNLDALRINVTVNGLPKIWWIDDVRMGWYENSCSKSVCRQNTRIR